MADNKPGDTPPTPFEMFPDANLGTAPGSPDASSPVAAQEDSASSTADVSSTSAATSPPSSGGARSRRKKQSASPGASDKAEAVSALPGSEAIAIVPANSVIIHPDLGISIEAMIEAHGDAVEEAADTIRRGIAPVEPPQVLRLDDGRLGALTRLEWIAAAAHLARRNPEATIAVRIVSAIDPAARVSEMLSSPRGRSGWEQYCGIRAMFEGGGVRDRLRSLDLDVDKWESKVSKVLKVGRLAPEILDAVSPLTIPVREAGQIVDAWSDEARRQIMQALLAEARRRDNARLNAAVLFKAMLRAVRPDVVEPTWQTGDDGESRFIAADGTVLASLSRIDGKWMAEGRTMTAARYRAMAKGLADLMK